MSSAAAFLAEFPSTDTNYCTGGNCSAWRVPLAGGWFALVSDGEGYSPDDSTRKVWVDIFDEDMASVDFEDPECISWATAIDLCRDWNRPEFRV